MEEFRRMEDRGEFARFFRRRMQACKMTHGSTAKALGVDLDTITKWADSSFVRLPPENRLEHIAEVIKTDLAELREVWQRSQQSRVVKARERRNLHLKANRDHDVFWPSGPARHGKGCGFGARNGNSSC